MAEGHGERVREDYSATMRPLVVLPPRTGPQPGLPLERGRHRRLLQSVSESVHGPCLWNERDPFLKERFFGLDGPEGNHGEDVKEYYFYLDATPTHSYMKMLYKYPQVEYPYTQLAESREGEAGTTRNSSCSMR